jgi:hypothetical protein
VDYRGVRVDIVQGDVLTYSCDLLVLKYAQASYGADKAVVEVAGINVNALPQVGQDLRVSRPRSLQYGSLLLLGVNPIEEFDYHTIREFSRRALATAAGIRPPVREIAMTMHGTGFGLDESAAFSSQIAGIVDGLESGAFPRGLAAISIVESVGSRAMRLREMLAELLRVGGPVSQAQPPLGSIGVEEARSRRITLAGDESATRSHAFVAMPFSDSFEDVFEFGIKPAVHAARLNCHRMDEIPFTGDIVTLMRERIASAEIVVADVSEANPNVYLEIGYAWGVAVPCVLVCNKKHELRFDVRGQRCLFYGSIKDLQGKLSRELTALLPGKFRRGWRPGHLAWPAPGVRFEVRLSATRS